LALFVLVLVSLGLMHLAVRRMATRQTASQPA
jgi:hypothetical protein